MAIGASSVWEVRPANGDNTHGGGFDASLPSAGTDFSIFDDDELTLTDLATADGTTVTVTSATGGFTAAMIGNVLRINSGTNWEVDFYFILTRVDTNTITVDRSPTSAAGTGGNGKVGGATATLGGQTTTTLVGTVVAGNKIHIKNEAWDEAVTFSTSGSGGAPIIWEGYNTSREDTPTGSNRPRNNRADVAGDCLTVSADNNTFRYIWVSNAGSNGWVFSSGADVQLRGVRSSNNGARGVTATTGTRVYVDCEIDTNTTDGLIGNSNGIGVYVHNNSAEGVDIGTRSITLVNSISEANASHGVKVTTGIMALINMTVDTNTGAATDGINGTTSNVQTLVINCIFSTNGDDGAAFTDGDSVLADFNCFFGNVGVPRTNFPTGANDSTADPGYTDDTGGDFSIGTNLKAKGFPGAFPAALSTGFLDIGAVQREEPAGAPGHATLTGGMQ